MMISRPKIEFIYKFFLTGWFTLAIIFYIYNANNLWRLVSFDGIASIFINNWSFAYFWFLGLMLPVPLWMKKRWALILLLVAILFYIFLGIFWWIGISKIEYFSILFVMLFFYLYNIDGVSYKPQGVNSPS